MQNDETLLSMQEAATWFNKQTGKKVTRQTPLNWYKRGLLINGERVHLEVKKAARRIFTTEKMLNDFLSKFGGIDF
jgi:hypothetical protein